MDYLHILSLISCVIWINVRSPNIKYCISFIPLTIVETNYLAHVVIGTYNGVFTNYIFAHHLLSVYLILTSFMHRPIQQSNNLAWTLLLHFCNHEFIFKINNVILHNIFMVLYMMTYIPLITSVIRYYNKVKQISVASSFVGLTMLASLNAVNWCINIYRLFTLYMIETEMQHLKRLNVLNYHSNITAVSRFSE